MPIIIVHVLKNTLGQKEGQNTVVAMSCITNKKNCLCKNGEYLVIVCNNARLQSLCKGLNCNFGEDLEGDFCRTLLDTVEKIMMRCFELLVTCDEEKESERVLLHVEALRFVRGGYI